MNTHVKVGIGGSIQENNFKMHLLALSAAGKRGLVGMEAILSHALFTSVTHTHTVTDL